MLFLLFRLTFPFRFKRLFSSQHSLTLNSYFPLTGGSKKKGAGPPGVSVDALLDTGALGIDGNYISLDIVDNMELENNFEPSVANQVSICSGLDGTCTKNPKSVTLNVHLIRNFKLQLKFFILASTPFDLIIGKNVIKHIA